MFSRWSLSLFLCTLFLAGCGGSRDSGINSEIPDPSAGPAVLGQQVKHSLATALDGNIGGYLEYLPGDYATSRHTYPLIIFCHGSGELGEGSATSLDNVAKSGLPRLLQEKTFPAGFTVNGETFSFMVVSPQFKSWPSVSNFVALLSYLKNQGMRMDERRVYVTGMSMGGGITWAAAGSASTLPSIAAVVPVCGALDSNDIGAKRIADARLPVWAFHNNGDPTVTVNNTLHWIDAINSHSPALSPRKTIFADTTHDAWTHAYDPDYWEVIDGQPLNIYEWMLSFRKP